MKAADVKIGATYLVKVSGSLAHVTIERENPRGGWDGRNVKTNRAVRIKSPQRLRSVAGERTAARKAPGKGDLCATCQKPLVVVDVDHKAQKSVYGCPDCDGSPLEVKRAAQKAKSKKVLEEATARDAEKKAQAEAAAAAKTSKKASKKADRGQERPGEKAMRLATKDRRQRGPVSGLDAAAKVLEEAGEPLDCKAIAEKAIAAGWVTKGATPHQTLYAAMLREIQKKGTESRFKKVGPGVFGLTQKGA